MRKFTYLLLGMLFGQLTLMPTVYKLYMTPRIVSELVDVRDDFYLTTEAMDFVIKDVSSVFFRGKKDLHIHIRTQPEIVLEYEKRYGENIYGLLGFYEPLEDDKTKHEIFSVNSTSVLTHEIRHSFEGYFHRSSAIKDGKCPTKP